MSNSAMTATAPSTRDDQRVEQRQTCEAAAVHLANTLYDEARATSNPAATLDNIADALPEVMPEVFRVMHTSPDLAAALLPAVTDRVWAYAGVEHARAEAGDGYGYVFDLLVDNLRKGGDPHVARTTALDVPRRIRESATQAEPAEQTAVKA